MSLDPRTTQYEFKWCGDFWFPIQMINEKIINKFYFSISLSVFLFASLSLSLSLSHTHTQTHTLYICIQVLQYNQFIVLKNITFVWLCIFINRCRDNLVHVKEGKITLSDIVYICWDWCVPTSTILWKWFWYFFVFFCVFEWKLFKLHSLWVFYVLSHRCSIRYLKPQTPDVVFKNRFLSQKIPKNTWNLYESLEGSNKENKKNNNKS